MNGSGERLDESVGCALDKPRLRLRLIRADRLDCTGGTTAEHAVLAAEVTRTAAALKSRPAEADDSLPSQVYVRRAAFRALAQANAGVLLDTSLGIRETFRLLTPRLTGRLP